MEYARIPCMKCIHYQVTFDPNSPRGCKLYQFRSTTMPYVLVKQSTGHDCTSFQEKKSKKEEEDSQAKKDFNDPKYWG